MRQFLPVTLELAGCQWADLGSGPKSLRVFRPQEDIRTCGNLTAQHQDIGPSTYRAVVHRRVLEVALATDMNSYGFCAVSNT